MGRCKMHRGWFPVGDIPINNLGKFLKVAALCRSRTGPDRAIKFNLIVRSNPRAFKPSLKADGFQFSKERMTWTKSFFQPGSLVGKLADSCVSTSRCLTRLLGAPQTLFARRSFASAYSRLEKSIPALLGKRKICAELSLRSGVCFSEEGQVSFNRQLGPFSKPLTKFGGLEEG